VVVALAFMTPMAASRAAVGPEDLTPLIGPILILTGLLLLAPVAIRIVVWAEVTHPGPAEPPR
jgi:hypothetical protein